MTRTKYNQTTEDRPRDALDYLEQNSEAKVATIAKEFGVACSQLRSRLNSRPPLNDLSSINTKLAYAEEKAFCRYIDRLDAINLHVRQEFVVDAVNTILRERAGKNSTPPIFLLFV
jgi:hypothetical protein